VSDGDLTVKEVAGNLEARHAHQSHTQPDVFGPSVSSVEELQTMEERKGRSLTESSLFDHTQSGIDTNNPSLPPSRLVPIPPCSETFGRYLGRGHVQIYDGTDEHGIVGTVARGLFAQEGLCSRTVYENPVGDGTHSMQPVT
jgi:hypothetical protein